MLKRIKRFLNRRRDKKSKNEYIMVVTEINETMGSLQRFVTTEDITSMAAIDKFTLTISELTALFKIYELNKFTSASKPIAIRKGIHLINNGVQILIRLANPKMFYQTFGADANIPAVCAQGFDSILAGVTLIRNTLADDVVKVRVGFDIIDEYYNRRYEKISEEARYVITFKRENNQDNKPIESDENKKEDLENDP